jgi:hypothetical protein
VLAGKMNTAGGHYFSSWRLRHTSTQVRCDETSLQVSTMLKMTQTGLMVLLGAAGFARSISAMETEAPNACSSSAFLNNTDFHDGQGLVMDIYTSSSTARFCVGDFQKMDPNCSLRHSNPGMCHAT